MIISQDIHSNFESVSEFALSAIDKLKSAGIKEEALHDIKLCLDEALINAVKHGNKLNPDLSVKALIDYSVDRVIIDILDRGKGYDIKSIPDPTKKENILRGSGRGVFLIKQLMDYVEVLNSGSRIRMTKFLNKEAIK